MSEIDLPAIDKTIHKTRLWLDDVMAGIETTNRAKAFRALRAVMHAMREMLPVAEGAHFASQLPMLLRGAYYEGWAPGVTRSPKARRLEDFLGAVTREYGDYPRSEIECVSREVFRVMLMHITRGEMEDVLQCLPAEVGEFLLSAERQASGQHAAQGLSF